MAKIPGPIGTALGVAKVAKSAYKAVKRVQANKKNMVSAKRKPVKKRNETPQTGMKTVTLNSNRLIAKDYKATTGKSLRASSNEFKSSNVYKSGNAKFKEGYKKPTKRLTEGYLNKKQTSFEQRIGKVLKDFSKDSDIPRVTSYLGFL